MIPVATMVGSRTVAVTGVEANQVVEGKVATQKGDIERGRGWAALREFSPRLLSVNSPVPLATSCQGVEFGTSSCALIE